MGIPEEDELPPPPPYSEGPAGSGAAIATNPEKSSTQNPTHQRFPSSFYMYATSNGGKQYMIAEDQDEPLYAVSLHSGWSGQPDVVLHVGPDPHLLPVAAVETGVFSFKSAAKITLAPPPGSGQGRTEERLESKGGLGGARHSFSIGVGGGEGQKESFEWRTSQGPEVDALYGKAQGWALVRLGSGDDGEIVAVWAMASASRTKELSFQFLGSGASGVLGETWAVMAVITALKIWDTERKNAKNDMGLAVGATGA